MIEQARMNHAYCVGSSNGWKMMQFQLALNKTFFSNPQPLTHGRLKQHQRKKISKAMLSAPPPTPPRPLPSGFPHRIHNATIEKQVSIPS